MQAVFAVCQSKPGCASVTSDTILGPIDQLKHTIPGNNGWIEDIFFFPLDDVIPHRAYENLRWGRN
jgi:hypothetical protein